MMCETAQFGNYIRDVKIKQTQKFNYPSNVVRDKKFGTKIQMLIGIANDALQKLGRI